MNASPSGPEPYDAAAYWSQRLESEFSLAGVGHAGLGLSFNRWAYAVRRAVLLRAVRDHGIRIQGALILELAFGTGFYLDIWRAGGASSVVGFDIAEVAVRAAQHRFGSAGWRLEQADISAPLPLGNAVGTFDISTAFDVLFHIVDDGGWNHALDSLCDAVRPGGHLLLLDRLQASETGRGHVKWRTMTAYREALCSRGCRVLSVRPVFFAMNSPADVVGGAQMTAAKIIWYLVGLPYRIGRTVGLGEQLGGAIGAVLYWPELAMGRLFSSGPSTKLLVALKQ